MKKPFLSNIQARKGMCRATAFASVAALTLLTLATGCSKKEPDLGPLVIVERPTGENVEIYGNYVGRIRAARFVEVHARVEGYLEKMLFAEGKHVKQNEPLFIISTALYRARVEKAKAALKKSEARMAKSQRDVERLRPLYEQRAASQLDLDNAVSGLENAIAEVAMSKADLAQAQLDLNYTTVTSPIEGYISERYADVGALVGPGARSKLAAIVKSDTVLVDFKMTSLDYLRAERRNVKFGEQDSSRSWQPYVTVTLADDSEYPQKGIVDFADPLVDPKTGTFGVRAELPNPDRVLLPGQFTKVRLLLDVHEHAIVVPRKALSMEKGGAFIYVVRRDSIAEKRFVQTGPEVGNRIVIERGLGQYEKVVTEGRHKLVPGMRVQPVMAGDDRAIELLKAKEKENL